MLASRLVPSKPEGDWQEASKFVLNKLKASKFPEAESKFEIMFALSQLFYKNA
jgi:hypothetical protein